MYINNEEDNQNLITNMKNKFKKLSEEKSTTILLVTVYAIISEIWIVLSDKFLIKILSNMVDSPISTIFKISSIKGSIYVILSSTLLYLFILKSMIKIKGLKSELQVSEERYFTLIKLLPDAVTIIKDDKYIFTNNAGAKLFGFDKPEHISGVPIKNLVHPEYQKMVEERIQSAKDKKVKLPLVEQKYIRTDGTVIEEKIMACDTDKIERIILNLLSNSIKFTKPGGNIYINIYDNIDSITLSIKDTGIGIPKDKLKMIFERFMQVDSSLQRENEGSGIGLALVKSLVEKHGGQISVKSKEGLGTEFIIKFPINLLATEVEDADNNNCNDHLVEKIHIEFSDIYSI